MRESAPRRAWNDTIAAQKTIRFLWVGDIVLVTAGGALLTTFAPNGVSNWELVARAVGGGLLGLVSAVGILFLYNFIRAPFRQRDEVRRELQNALLDSCPWYFRYGGGGFHAKSQDGPYLGIKDMTITNLLDSPNSISHLFIEVTDASGRIEHMPLSDPQGFGIYGNGERLEAPLYFRTKETKVGYLAFMLDTLEGVKKYGIPAIHIRDGNGTDYRFRTDPKALLQMQEASRTVDYPPPS